jgi:hypothetical protein
VQIGDAGMGRTCSVNIAWLAKSVILPTSPLKGPVLESWAEHVEVSCGLWTVLDVGHATGGA